MESVLVRMKRYICDFVPKTIVSLREGYSKSTFFHDLFAGISVGFIALPLALAFAIGSGVQPEQGLFTAIVAGFLISLLGGSRVQIGGPTGAYVPVVYAIIQNHGYEGLAIATLMAGFILMVMGVLRCGVLLKFVPNSVIIGFTTGIALVIFVAQLKDFFGLHLPESSPHFIEKCYLLCSYASTFNSWAFFISSGTLAAIFLLRRFFPRLPSAILAVIIATFVSLYWEFPILSIETAFGPIPTSLPTASFPNISYEEIQTLLPSAVTIALLGAIESLLSAAVADSVTGQHHNSNTELFAQGLANVASPIFGGIPATGAIARTSANIRLGAKTPFAGMIHAVTLLLLMIFFAPLAGKIPLAALSAVLVFVAWNMSELEKFAEILKSEKVEALILLTTFVLTVLVDLAFAVQVGVGLNLIFVYGKSLRNRILLK